MPGPPVVIKIGGSTLGSHDTSLRDLVTLQREGMDVVVVHGGGNVISEWMQRQGIPPRFVRGLRVTDAASLEIVVAVLTGLINKELVSGLHALGGKAIGISGIDGGLLQARIADPELGFVGEIDQVNQGPIQAILDSGYIPMVAPLAMDCDNGSDHSGGPLNINGDTVAGELAHAMGAKSIIFLTDVEGIMDGNGRVMRRLDRRTANILFNSGIIQGGMIPKLAACLRALESRSETERGGVNVPVAYVVDGRRPEALLECVRGNSTGTTIVSDFTSQMPSGPRDAPA
ncbi:MAG: acetylglutamate kinase [SAR202 cluster bacterium Io17-Chloro-G9]|nr:MAG: acetylglutamate kinase [SAR202 cluster bacterium Io17-Chloro-G9]